VEQDDGGQQQYQQRSQTVNIPVEVVKSEGDIGGGVAVMDQLRDSLKTLDEMKSRFVDERKQWNAERDRLKATDTEVYE